MNYIIPGAGGGDMFDPHRQIRYIKGMKYQLAATAVAYTPVVGLSIEDKYFKLEPDGKLTVYEGYAWDGASGFTYDSESSMRSSLFHDVFCYLMREGLIDYAKWQDKINAFFHRQCLEDGMFPPRARVWYAAVEFANAGDPTQGPDREVFTAPRRPPLL